jgi:hypothetical protein
MNKKYKGGIRISSDYIHYYTTEYNKNVQMPFKNIREAAIYYFLNNSTFSVLTNDSISCITIKSTLNSNIKSPFKSMRSNDIQLEIRCILLKIFLTVNNHQTNLRWFPIPNRGDYNGIEITPIQTFKNEIKTQMDIYKVSFISESSILDGICPAIIYLKENYDKDDPEIKKFRNLPGMSKENQLNLDKIMNGIFKHHLDGVRLSIIFMEFMDNFKTAGNYFTYDINTHQLKIRNDRDIFLLKIIQYEFQRLNRLGYLHNDAHLGNVMINEDYNYFLINPNDNKYKGRAIIIDFGRTVKLTDNDRKRAQAGDTRIFNQERYIKENMIPSNAIINNTEYNLLRQSRINYINRITSPYILNTFNIYNRTLHEFVGEIVNNNNYILSGGKAILFPNQKIDYNPTEPANLLQLKNNQTKPDNLLQLKNNQTKELIPVNNMEFLHDIFVDFKLELEKQENTDFSKLDLNETITSQIINMKYEDFNNSVLDQYYDKELNEIITEKNNIIKIKGGKIKKRSKKKNNKYKKTKRVNK